MSEKALNPPKGECRQCWYHAYASREAHAHLGRVRTARSAWPTWAAATPTI